MRYRVSRWGAMLVAAGCLAQGVLAQKAYTWEELRDRFEASNRQLRAGRTIPDS